MDKIIPAYKFDRNFDVFISIPPREHWFNGILPPEHGTSPYMDGSLIEDAAGAGIF